MLLYNGKMLLYNDVTLEENLNAFINSVKYMKIE